MSSAAPVRRGAPWLLLPVAAMLLLCGCGLDGSDPDVRALAPPTTVAGPAGPNSEMAPEQSADEAGVQVLASLPDVPPAHLPQASLPHVDRAFDMPDTAAVVGDSLTESAQQEIGSYLKGLGVDIVTIDGAKNRRMAHGSHPDPGIDIVERIARVTHPDVWVIALGTNDVGAQVSPDQYAADITSLLEKVPEGAPVVWVNVWIRDRQQQVEVANQVLHDTLAGRPDTIVADWFEHGDDAGLIAKDGIHLTDDGRYMFAATIAAATVDLFEQ